MLTRRLPFDEIRGNDLRVLWAIHSGKRPPPILGCPEQLESLMNRCWNKDARIRPTMGEIVVIMSDVQQFFPQADDPLDFPEEINEDDDEKSSSSYQSAKENLNSKSEVVKVDEIDVVDHKSIASSSQHKSNKPADDVAITVDKLKDTYTSNKTVSI